VSPGDREFDESVHVSAVHVRASGLRGMWPTTIHEARIVERRNAMGTLRIRDAYGRHSVLHRDPIRARERAEVAIEGSVLLHHHDHVLDLVEPGEVRGRLRLCRGPTDARGGG
jgi:hypothetical protein